MTASNSPAAGPQRDTQADLQPRQRDHVRPKPTFEDPRHSCMRDAGGVADNPKASAVDRVAQRESNLPSDLGDFVLGAGRRPVDAELSGQGSDRAGHSPSVSQAIASTSELAALENAHRALIQGYRPKLPGPTWATVRPAVIAWMEELGVMESERTRRFLRNLTQLAVHAHTQGWGLATADVFDEDVIRHFTDQRLAQTGKPRPQDISVLKSARKALLGPNRRDLRIQPAKIRTTAAPYGGADLPAIEQWATARKDRNHRRTASAIIALSMGCGLESSEMIGVRSSDVVSGPNGLSVLVGGKRARLIPILTRWQGLLVDAVERSESSRTLIGVQSDADHPKYVGNYLHRHDGPELSRLRITWIVSHLEWGTPIDALAAASGNKYLDWLLPYLALVNRDADSADRLLRGAGAVR